MKNEKQPRGIYLKYNPDTAERLLQRTRPNPESFTNTKLTSAWGVMDEVEYAALYQEAKEKGLVG